ncbi:MAG: nucleotide exchange factor GrpE [candidate division KSB1 bacterium]|nr:nucleotide exchange factor GrpE [candidate division KSB1 bacterium]MDZ7304584.1 nucleotide exchange factor GrpE [candidate division KSB1 bacterium]MDZ7313621.1 nucleotide exchange factor GrpE [candidate division KSB1 bacterium]
MEKEKNLRSGEKQDSTTPDLATSPGVEDGEELPIEAETATTEESTQPQPSEQELQNGGATSSTTTETQPSLAELQDRFLRLAADFANYKRRNEIGKAEIADWARRELALSLLPILDDFDLMADYESQNPERLAEGAKLIRQKMMELLSKQGLEKIKALNQPYDYEFHEAVMTQPVQDRALDQIVLSVIQEGYLFKGKILRPSKVIVGQYSGTENDTNSSPSLRPDNKTEENKTEPN